MSVAGFVSTPRIDLGPAPPEEPERTYDVCVIGSGAAGSVAASELCASGLDVVMVEQGGYVDERTSYEDLVLASEPAYVRVHSGCFALQGYPWTTCNVGGGTVFYGGASFRYREVDFDASDHLPEAELPVAWPYGYDELERYYGEVESSLGIAADPSGDVTAPPSPSAAYLPPIEPSRAGRVIRAAALSLGLSPFPTPLAIATVPHRGRAVCENDSPCIERVCARGAKADTTVFLKPLLARGEGFTLFAGLKAVRLDRSERTRVRELLAVRTDTGSTHRIRARAFVVACNAIQSAALLLRSADRFCPAGLGNENDLVGRGLCFKISEWVTGLHEEPGASGGTRWNQGPFSTVALTDHYLDSAAPGGLGGLIYEAGYGTRYSLRASETVVRIEAMLGDQPRFDNRVRLAPDTDERGLNRLVMDYTPHPRDVARLEHMVERCRELLGAGECRSIRREGKVASVGAAHLHGTCRGGLDRETSVVDSWSRVHSVDNVYVFDGAFMPYPGGVNPTLTIQAHALRCARALAGSLKP